MLLIKIGFFKSRRIFLSHYLPVSNILFVCIILILSIYVIILHLIINETNPRYYLPHNFSFTQVTSREKCIVILHPSTQTLYPLESYTLMDLKRVRRGDAWTEKEEKGADSSDHCASCKMTCPHTPRKAICIRGGGPRWYNGSAAWLSVSHAWSTTGTLSAYGGDGQTDQRTRLVLQHPHENPLQAASALVCCLRNKTTAAARDFDDTEFVKTPVQSVATLSLDSHTFFLVCHIDLQK